MKLSHPISIDFLTFFKTGKFDYLTLGKSKEWILNNFPDPDGDCKKEEYLKNDFNIWQYGDIELHFEEDKLSFIFSDNWYEWKLSGGKSLKLEKWIFEDISKLSLRVVLEALNSENIDYKKKTEELGILLRLSSGIELTFVNINDVEGMDSNNYHITSFALIAEYPSRWAKTNL